MKYLLLFFSFFLSFLSLPTPLNAQQEFKTEFHTTYEVDKNGDAHVIQDITLTNNFSTIYATSYGLSLEGKKPSNVRAFQGKEELKTSVEETETITKIGVTFSDAVVGKDKSRNFRVEYTVPKLATQNGQVWELVVPRVSSSENFDVYDLTLLVPKVFGKIAYVSPPARTTQEEGTNYTFTFEKDDLVKAGVVAAFGDFQVFSFNLTYHLENPYGDKNGKTEIALVPDTAFQRVYYEAISPKPSSVKIDEDGNWLATYTLKPKEKLDVITAGNVQLFSKPQELYIKSNPQTSSYYLAPSKYWQTQDPEIASVASTLKTPRAIYDYVVDKLDYNYDRVDQISERLGAKSVLSNPENAICMEFTDLYVALSRSAGIPAREVNGYAYTENPEIQPLSLVADVLHAWPEYWDSKSQIWKPIDPTWGNTTGGVDFFDKFDLAHITFAIHGKDPDLPAAAGSYKLAGSNERDVQVSFGRLPDKRESLPQIKISSSPAKIPFFEEHLKIKITNPGPTALYDQNIRIDTQGVSIKNSTAEDINFLAPFDTKEIDLHFAFPLIGGGKSSRILVTAGQSTAVYEVPTTRLQLIRVASFFGTIILALLLGYAIIRFLRKRKQKNAVSTTPATPPEASGDHK